MASPYTMYFAGMGTVVAALAVGFSTAVMMTSPLPEQKEQPTGFEKRAAKPERPAEPAPPVPERRLDAPVSPLITAIQTPMTSTTTASAPPASAPQPPAMNQSTQSAAQEPGMLQPPVRPGAPPQIAAAPSTQVTPPAQAAAAVAAPPEQVIAPQPAQPAIRSREAVRNPDMTGSIDPVTGQWKKKEKRDTAQKKQRRPIEQTRPAQQIEEDVVETRATTGVETRSTTGYSSEPRAPAPLGIFNLLLGGGQ